MERASSPADDPQVLLRAADAARDRARRSHASSVISIWPRAPTRTGSRRPRGAAHAARARVARGLGRRAGTRARGVALQLLPGGAGRISGAVLRVELGEPPRPVRLLLDSGSPACSSSSAWRASAGSSRWPRKRPSAAAATSAMPACAAVSQDRLRAARLSRRPGTTTEGEFDPRPLPRGHRPLRVRGIPGDHRPRTRSLVLEPPQATAPANASGRRGSDARPGRRARGPTGAVPVRHRSEHERAGAEPCAGDRGSRAARRSTVVGLRRAARGCAGGDGDRGAIPGRDTGDGALRAADLAVRSRLGGVELAGYVGLDLLAGERWIIDPLARKVSAE